MQGVYFGVKLNRYNSSFPVGKIKIIKMYPMDFEEFLWGIEENELILQIEKSFQNMSPMPEILHKKALMLYKHFLCIGGMPAAINEYIEIDKNIFDYLGDEKSDIITSYIADMTKYTTSVEALKVNEIYKNLPEQLAKENKKFMYQLISKNARSRDYETSIEWLIQSEIVLKCSMITSPNIPLEAYKQSNIFKIYFNDIGLFLTHAKVSNTTIISDIDIIYKGAIVENYVAEVLKTKGYELYYFKKENSMEIDFLIEKDDNVIPIEVKAGENIKSKSLDNYVKTFNPKYSIRISARNFGFENNIKSIPLYAVYLI